MRAERTQALSVGKPKRSFLKAIDIAALLVIHAFYAWILWNALHPSFYYLVWLPFLVLFGLATCMIFALIIAFGSIERRTVPWKSAFVVMLTLPILIYFQIPLKLAFLTVRPKLEQAMASTNAAVFKGLDADISSPLFRISADSTNWRLEYGRTNGFNTNRILFILADDSESAFIYSPGGIQNLAFNSGVSGHLIGDWYWMKEDQLGWRRGRPARVILFKPCRAVAAGLGNAYSVCAIRV